METFVSVPDILSGMAWDPNRRQVYSSTDSLPTSRIYRVNVDGSEVVKVLDSSACESYSSHKDSYIFLIRRNQSKRFPVELHHHP